MRYVSIHCVAIALVVAITAPDACADGADYPAGRPTQQERPDWPEEWVSLANDETRVQGHWVASNDFFYYRGDLADFNDFVSRYGMLPEIDPTLILHVGKTPITGPLGSKEKTIPFNWKMEVYRRGWGAPIDPRRASDAPGYVVTLHVWLSEDISLEDLDIPEHVDVRSGGELEEFINQHRRGTKSTTQVHGQQQPQESVAHEIGLAALRTAPEPRPTAEQSEPRADVATQEDVRTAREDGDIAAPIVYENLMLVLVNSKGAAAVIFTGDLDVVENAREERREGVSYRYRYQSRDGKNTFEGTGVVFERRSLGSRTYQGGRLFIKAGPIRLGWSYGDAGRGWIYYTPEELRVHIATAERFDDGVEVAPFDGTRFPVPKLDLKRFMSLGQ